MLLFVVTMQTIMLFDKVRQTTRRSCADLRSNLPIWPFFAVAWLGDVSAVLLIAVRTFRLIFRPEALADACQIRTGRVRRR